MRLRMSVTAFILPLKDWTERHRMRAGSRNFAALRNGAAIGSRRLLIQRSDGRVPHPPPVADHVG